MEKSCANSGEYFAQIPVGRANQIDKKQLAMATQLIEAYSHPFHLDAFKDDYEAALRELIEAKQKKAPLPLEEKRARPAKVINLMDALRQSVSKAKRPVASERRSRPRLRAEERARSLWAPVNASTSCIGYGCRTKTNLLQAGEAKPSARRAINRCAISA